MSDTENPVLLVVDDVATQRTMVRTMFGKRGFVVVEAENGEDGVRQFEQHRPNVVLMDVNMPVMDGFEAVTRIRRIDRGDQTPIIMLTGAEDTGSIERSLDVGATDFIVKPFKWPILIQRVRYAIRNHAMTRELRANRIRQSAAQRIAQLGFWSWDNATQYFSFSSEAADLLGSNSSQLPETVDDLAGLLHGDDQVRLRHAFRAAAIGGGRIELESRFNINGDERVLRIIGERDRDSASERYDYFGALQDITGMRKTEEMIDFLANHDDLTGLVNRKLFAQLLRREIDALEHGGGGRIIAVVWIDLARFHRHNDALGEEGGNLLLNLVGQRLKAHLPKDSVARVGGDEFAVRISMPLEDDPEVRLERLLDRFSEPFKINQQETFLNISAGYVLVPKHGRDVEQLLTYAQEAQRIARSQARSLAPWGDSGRLANSRLLETERELRSALDLQQFRLVYQPQFDLRSRVFVGVESLLRWHHPERGIVSPAEFVPLLEESGLIYSVGRWIIHEACRQAQQWASAGVPLRVGINLSARQFHDPKLLPNIDAALAETGVAHDLIELEVTESLAMEEPERAIALLAQLRNTGCKIAIDDFGIGHSSLEYLLRFPLDTIKIDRTFVMNITSSQADRAIVRAVTAIAQTLGLSTIAEGIEDQRQSDFLEALGVTEIQGYLMGRPMPPDDLLALVRRSNTPDAKSAT